MLAALITALAVVLGPLLGSAVRASRRNRLAARVRTLLALADSVEPHDRENAAALRQLASKRTERLIDLEQASLRRRFDPAAPFAFAVFLLPGAVASYFAWTRSGWWTWPVVVLSAVLTVTFIAAAWDELWKEYEEAEQERAEK